MTMLSKFIKVAVAVAATGAVVASVHYVSAAQDNTASPSHKEDAQPGVVKFAPNAPQLSSLKVSVVTEVPLPVSDPVNGRITYDENVTTRITSPIVGRVIGLHAEIGDAVQRGTILADIDSPDLATAEADWRKAQADELRKKLALDRARTLFEGEVLARKDYESAEADFQQAKAETTRAVLRMKNLNALGKEDGKFGLKSPIAGVLADKQINPGQEVRPDLPNPLFVITNLNSLWVIVDLPERNIAEIRPGQAVTIDTDAYPEQQFAGKVDRVGLALDPVTRRIQVRCSVKNNDHRLKPEMFARISFLAGDGGKKAIVLPNTSLFVEGMYSYVFVEKQPGVFEKRRVNVKVKGSDRSFIDMGLAKGDRVVTEGAFLLNAEVAGDAQ
ncbi:MAG TPA: efflux RND transporter periplasmic adaptor subunit [Burkholderiaceae bacterium]|jgi:cobalt-zinc-cadmium efflux system membrane fusion protein